VKKEKSRLTRLKLSFSLSNFFTFSFIERKSRKRKTAKIKSSQKAAQSSEEDSPNLTTIPDSKCKVQDNAGKTRCPP
jgi:hypothetical protein